MKFKAIGLAALSLSLAFGQIADALSITIERNGSEISIVFAGTLQAAPSVAGPWEDVPGAASPHRQESSGSAKFFRTREAGPQSIFSSSSVVELIITGPLQEHFDLAFAGMPDGINPPVREKPYFDGSLQTGGFDLPISLRVRGNSSLQECPFPKLKFKVSRETRAGTPFFDAREIKIGTHCAEGGRGPIGRLREETATYREALVYEIMQLLGFVAPRVRRASIEYRDTTPTNEMREVGWEIRRKAVILDDIEVVGERMGGRALDDEDVAALTDANFNEQTVTELRLFHALLGNWDYAVSLDGQEMWNTDVIELPSKQLVPVAGDFDLASWVTERALLSAPWDYHPELEEIDREARYRIEQIQGNSSGESFAAAKERFVQRRAVLETTINSALVDEPGRTNALRHVSAFFAGFEPIKR